MHDHTPNSPTILVATDFTPASRAAFDSGVKMAKEEGGRLVLVHALRPLGAPGLELTRPDTTRFENETAAPGDILDVPVAMTGTDWVDLARAQGVDADVVVRPGLPAAVIAEEAERVQATAVILGSSRKGGLEKLVLGSVAEAVQRATDRPVVVVGGIPEPGL
ncbi:MAG TPA: universal stress protein [Candidatus Thermoplasmatota archaeon]|nr:universal stress protein [Candidatus Thermoplasmatota archaeon]